MTNLSKIKNYDVFIEQGEWSETIFLVPEEKKDIVRSFKRNKNMTHSCKSVIQKNFINRCFVDGGDYYSLHLGE